MTQNTENTYNKIWHKIRKHGKYLQWNTTHSSRKIPTTKYDTKYGNIKIPTTKYDTKYGKYLQRNMTQNTENTYNKIRHKIRKHGKYQQWNMTQSYFQKTSAPDDTRPFSEATLFYKKITRGVQPDLTGTTHFLDCQINHISLKGGLPHILGVHCINVVETLNFIWLLWWFAQLSHSLHLI